MCLDQNPLSSTQELFERRLSKSSILSVKTESSVSEDDLINLGFKRVDTFTVAKTLYYHLGRNKYLSVSDIGTTMEMIYLYESDPKDFKKIDELIAIHNFDYQGNIDLEKIKTLIKVLSC